MTDQVVLRMRDIVKSFPGVRALSGVDLTVHAGEVAALLGENGAGKSTLMNILAGVLRRPRRHASRWTGSRSRSTPPRTPQRHGIAMIHQELNLVPELSIADNIFLGREPRTRLGHRRPLGRARTDRASCWPGWACGCTRGGSVRQCRIAEQQLIEVAKALSLNVRILVMDEPTSALADAEVRRLFAVIRDLTARGVAVVYISHRLEELEEIADSVTVLRDGSYIGRRDDGGHDAGRADPDDGRPPARRPVPASSRPNTTRRRAAARRGLTRRSTPGPAARRCTTST